MFLCNLWISRELWVSSAHFKYLKKENVSKNILMQNQLDFPKSQYFQVVELQLCTIIGSDSSGIEASKN